ncbi:MAG: phosphate ABC transporter substrate-binding/OmpA family protein [Planctomycetota bacterium]
MSKRSTASCIAVIVVWLLVLAALAAGYRFVVVPWMAAGNQQEQAVEAYDELAARAAERGITAAPLPDDASLDEIDRLTDELERRLTSAAADNRPIDHRVALSLDAFSGYAVLRSDDFRNRLADRRIAIDLVDDGADYPARLDALATGRTPLAVFTVDALLRAAAASGDEPPATVVMVIDETVGADGIVARQSALPNIESLNRPDARVLAVPDSPSDTLARVMLGNFALPDASPSIIQPADGPAEAFNAFRSADRNAPLAAALWEPYLSQALDLPDTHLLIDSGDFRGYIVDVLVAERRFLIDNEPVVRAIVEAYMESAYRVSRTPGGWAALVRQDAQRLGEPLTPQQADRLVEGVWWKNTLENYAHFGLDSRSRAADLPTLDRVVANLTGVLRRTDAIADDPLDGRPGRLYFDGILAAMQADAFHPGGTRGTSTETIRTAEAQPALDDAAWAALAPVGRLQTDRLVFARGTDRLTTASQRSLDELVDTLESWPRYYVRVRGHARSIGDADANRRLAESRAQAATQYLVNAGVPRQRLRAVVAPELGQGGQAQSVTFELGEPPY